MKLTFAILAALAIAGCTATPQMIEAQKSRCTQVGYTPGTTAHAECTERGTAQQQATQNAAAASAGAAITGGLLGAAMY